MQIEQHVHGVDQRADRAGALKLARLSRSVENARLPYAVDVLVDEARGGGLAWIEAGEGFQVHEAEGQPSAGRPQVGTQQLIERDRAGYFVAMHQCEQRHMRPVARALARQEAVDADVSSLPLPQVRRRQEDLEGRQRRLGDGLAHVRRRGCALRSETEDAGGAAVRGRYALICHARSVYGSRRSATGRRLLPRLVCAVTVRAMASSPEASVVAALSWPHRLWRQLPARPRRALLAHAAALMAPSITRPAPAAAHGIAGEGARLMLRALSGLGVSSWPVDVGAALPASSGGERCASVAPPDGAPLVVHVNAPLLPLALRHLPRGVVRGRRVIGYWAWELPTLPPDWRAGARFVHEVWVPSRFTATALETLLPGRVRVVPHPVAAAPPEPAPLDRTAFGLPDDAVVVLVSFNLASSLERKNPLGAIAAFRAAFGERSDRLLLLKIGHPGHFPADFERLRTAVAGVPNIRLDTTPLPRADSHALTRAADIILSLHRSEGFGLVAAEAMLLGRPVIATAWSGNMDFMDETSAALVGYRLIPARDPRGVFEADGAEWADPVLGDAVAQLRRLADDAQERRALGARGRAMAQARLGAEPLAAALRAIGLPAP
jgi:glycosyltransferase involved in cell wall biosynthesis